MVCVNNKITYETTFLEVEKALRLANRDKKIVVEIKDKLIVVCELSKEQVKKLAKPLLPIIAGDNSYALF